jgi:3-deoxy-7-phosphoheptulonate synthase
MVNGSQPTLSERIHDPKRMEQGYFRSTATLNLVRAFTRGGYAALDHVHSWSEAHLDSVPARLKYEEIVKGIRKSINFTKAIGLDSQNSQFNEVTLFTSHEALLLEYEEALTRIDTETGLWYDTSAHFLWLGDRTRQIDGAHVEFLRGINNPIGMKIGPNYDINEIKQLVRTLNPLNEAGRLTLITRFGSKLIEEKLPILIKEIEREGFKVVWMCDPMHGNTYTNNLGQKTRLFEDIVEEIRLFWKIHQSESTVAGGVHLELTGDNVTECVGGNSNLLDEDLLKNYQSSCDPRLNAEQAVELAFELAKIINP